MRNLPLVSCIMPTYNRRAFVSKAIEYFIRQDYPNRELVIVDDGTDAVKDLVPVDSRIRWLRPAKRLTTGAKRNLANKEAEGEIILHWDDDDWMAPHRIRYQVETLLNEKADICGLDKLYFFDPLAPKAWQYVYPKGSRPWLAGGTLCYKKTFWNRNPFPEIRVGEDTRFVWSKCPKKLVTLKDNTFYVALVHKGNTSPKRTRDRRWNSHPVEEIRNLMGEDWNFYSQPVSQTKTSKGKKEETPGFHRDHVIVSIPYFRCKKYIRRAVESILEQTHSNLTLVVVNDGDEDPPWDELAHIDDPRLVRFNLKSNRGRYFADAVVLHAADTPYFLIQDADDWSEPDRIELLLKTMNMTNADFVISACHIYKRIGSRLLPEQTLTYPKLKKPVSGKFEFRSDHHGLFRTGVLKEVGGYYGGYRIGYDTFIINLLSLIGKVAYIDKPLYNRVIRPDSLTTSTVTGMNSTRRGTVRKQLGNQYRDAFELYNSYRSGHINKEILLERIRDICRCQSSPEENREIMLYKDELRGYLNITGKTSNRCDRHPGEESDLHRLIACPGLKWTEWTVTPPMAFEIIRRLFDRKPGKILEVGSGITSILMAKYASLFNAEIVTLEHDRRFFDRTDKLLKSFGLRDFVDLKFAPLTLKTYTNGQSYRWYNEELKGMFDFIFIDGPPMKYGRSAALFALYPNISKNTEVYLHNGHREHERHCIKTWETYYSFFRTLYKIDKGLWTLKHIRKRS